jgi:hypothetical protein
MFGLPVTPESIAVIRDDDQVFLSLHFSFNSQLMAEAWCQFLEGFLKAEAERSGWDCEKIEMADYHGA